MPKPRRYDADSKEAVFDTLRREILAARLKVTLDEQLNRKTSSTVKQLAQMKLPPIVRHSERVERTKVTEAQTSRTKAIA